jgi:hypothetical protein
MKYYHVTLQVNSTAPRPAEDDCALLRMELLFTVGDNATHIPVGARPDKPERVTVNELIRGTLYDLHLVGLMDVREVDEITKEQMEHYAYNS